MHRTLALVISAAVMCASCDDGGSTNAAGSASAESTESAAASASPKEADGEAADVGGGKMGTFVCKDYKDKVCVGPTEVLTNDVPVVHVVYRTKDDLPKDGDVYQMQWIAEDVGKAAKPNTVIGTLHETAADIPDFGLKHYTINTQLSKPTKGWPVGKYRVEIKRGDKLVTTARFAIEMPKEP